MIYRIILALRHLAYDKGWKKVTPSPVPSVCVGNVTVGGTGKTPHTEMILRKLTESALWISIAVLSRGYGRKTKGFRLVKPGDQASMCGDEPLQIASKFPGVTVAVDRDRVEGCGKLSSAGAGVIVLDDAFQYRRLKASLDIVLVDYNRPVFRDCLLPWGRLRDLPSRLGKAGIVIVTKCPSSLDEQERDRWAASLKIQPSQKLFFTTTAYDAPAPVFPEEADPRFLYSKRLILVSGIANDAQLRSYLSDSYTISGRLSFPDHHAYTRSDIRSVGNAVKANPTCCIMTTEKDAQRLREVASLPTDLRQRLFYIPIKVQFLTPGEEAEFTSSLIQSLGGEVLL